MRQLIAAACVAGLCSAAQAQLGFKDLVLGAPLGTDSGMAISLKRACLSTGREVGELACSLSYKGSSNPETIAGHPVRHVLVVLWQDKVTAVTVDFDADVFDDVREAVATKHPELACKSSEVRNRYGAVLDQVDCRVGRGGDILVMKKRGPDTDTGRVNILSAGDVAREAARREEAKRDF